MLMVFAIATGADSAIRVTGRIEVTANVKPRNRKSTAKGGGAPKSIDKYLARVPEPARATLRRVRAAIRSAAPKGAVETISYGIPAFKHKGMLVWFAAFSGHCSLFPGASVIERHRDDLKGYRTSKGTIRFPVDRPLPAALVRKLVRARARENEERSGSSAE